MSEWAGEDLYHLALGHEWREAVDSGAPYERSTIGRSLGEVGFIHLSFEHQVAATFERFYTGRDDVVCLRIAADAIGDDVVVEDLIGAGEAFPHLYGPLPLDAVRSATPHGSP